MEWWQIVIFLVSVYLAYSAGHWVGYGKGEQDTKELTEEIRKLNKRNSRHLRWARKPQEYRVRSFQQALDSRLDSRFAAKSKNHLLVPVTYKANRRRSG